MTLDDFVNALGRLDAPDKANLIFVYDTDEYEVHSLSHTDEVSFSVKRGDLSECQEVNRVTVALKRKTYDKPQDSPEGGPYPEGVTPPKLIHPPRNLLKDAPVVLHRQEPANDLVRHAAEEPVEEAVPSQDYGINPDDFPEKVVPSKTDEELFADDPYLNPKHEGTGVEPPSGVFGSGGANGGVQRK